MYIYMTLYTNLSSSTADQGPTPSFSHFSLPSITSKLKYIDIYLTYPLALQVRCKQHSAVPVKYTSSASWLYAFSFTGYCTVLGIRSSYVQYSDVHSADSDLSDGCAH